MTPQKKSKSVVGMFGSAFAFRLKRGATVNRNNVYAAGRNLGNNVKGVGRIEARNLRRAAPKRRYY